MTTDAPQPDSSQSMDVTSQSMDETSLSGHPQAQSSDAAFGNRHSVVGGGVRLALIILLATVPCLLTLIVFDRPNGNVGAHFFIDHSGAKRSEDALVTAGSVDDVVLPLVPPEEACSRDTRTLDATGKEFRAGARPPVPATPATVKRVISLESFTLDQPYRTNWRKGRPLVNGGTILTIEVDHGLVYPREDAEPILYVGSHVAEWINSGADSRFVAAIVPGQVNLDQDLIWFGTPGLPEEVDDGRAAEEMALAKAAGIKPLDSLAALSEWPAQVRTTRLTNRKDLLRYATELSSAISSPDLVGTLLLPKPLHELEVSE